MPELLSLESRKESYWKQAKKTKARIIVCAGSACIAGGALKIFQHFHEVIAARGLSASVSLQPEESEYHLSPTGCQGFCQMGPLVTIYPQGILYTKVSLEDVEEIVQETVIDGRPIKRLLYSGNEGFAISNLENIPFYEKQNRITLALCGKIDYRDLNEYIAHDGYFCARKAILEMSEEEICNELLTSELRGRGGAGFLTGAKWNVARQTDSNIKYIICNGDEGDPGAFMDRCIMEGNPHSVIEGMIIAAAAIGANAGYIYVRSEYPLAVERLKQAVVTAREAGILGRRIFDSRRNFDIRVLTSAGAFICGEETALIASIEGKRGTPTLKPPFPAISGLFGKPTVINNVETLATVPQILGMGASEYRKLGTPSSSGTKTFALTGHVAHTGLIEVEFGTTLRQIIGEIGGGVVDDAGNPCGLDYKAVMVGGPSGGFLTAAHLDMPLDIENLEKLGLMIGSGGLVVMNQNTCIVKMARFFMNFARQESCGKCVVCREGTKQMLFLLDDIIEGNATAGTLTLLEELAETVRLGSFCGLGKTAANPVMSTLHFFREEYNAHVFEKRCDAGSCTALTSDFAGGESIEK